MHRKRGVVFLQSAFSRISEIMRHTADKYEEFIRNYHQPLDSAAARSLLVATDVQLHARRDKATAREVLEALDRAVVKERRLLTASLREMAGSALQQQQLLLVLKQREQGLSPLQRLHQNAINRLLATRQGAAALSGWRRLSSAASELSSRLGQLPLLRQLLQSPVAAVWRNRKPIDISLHYLSPTAFGLSAVR